MVRLGPFCIEFELQFDGVAYCHVGLEEPDRQLNDVHIVRNQY